MNYKMPLKINPQYVSQVDRKVALTLHPSFVLEHPQVRSDNILIHNITEKAIVFSIINGDEMTVFCCALQISMPPKYGQTQIEITSETQMNYFTENLSRRLPSLIWHLNNQMMFNGDAKAEHLREIGNNLDVVPLTENLFMVMFHSTIYFFQIDSEGDVVCSKLPLWKLNQTTYEDYEQCIPNLDCFYSSRFYTELNLYGDRVCFDVYSDVFDNRNSCMRASVTIHFDDDDDTLEKRVECSITLISRGVDKSLCSSTTEPNFEETRFSDKTLRIRNKDSDEEDSDEEKEDRIFAVKANDGNRIYVFEKLDDTDFFCILFRNGIVHLLQVDRSDLSTLKSSNSEELIANSEELITMFEIDSVDLSEKLERFGEVDFSCRIDIADPIQITCYFDNSFGDTVLREQFIIENDEFVIS
jgi:hypothetical protein